jgi:hypothetical protein
VLGVLFGQVAGYVKDWIQVHAGSPSTRCIGMRISRFRGKTWLAVLSGGPSQEWLLPSCMQCEDVSSGQLLRVAH